jgi:hypothetical protein
VVSLMVIALAATGAGAATVVGTAGPDRLGGTNADDLIRGLAGNDTIHGRRGNDLVRGGDGADRIFGGPGIHDDLRGNHGADALFSGAGGASLRGGLGHDRYNMKPDGTAVPSPGNDTIHARDGNSDMINCGAGYDVAYVDRAEEGVFECEQVIYP